MHLYVFQFLRLNAVGFQLDIQKHWQTIQILSLHWGKFCLSLVVQVDIKKDLVLFLNSYYFLLAVFQGTLGFKLVLMATSLVLSLAQGLLGINWGILCCRYIHLLYSPHIYHRCDCLFLVPYTSYPLLECELLPPFKSALFLFGISLIKSPLPFSLHNQRTKTYHKNKFLL